MRGVIVLLSLGILPTCLLAFSLATVTTLQIVEVVHGTKQFPHSGCPRGCVKFGSDFWRPSSPAAAMVVLSHCGAYTSMIS